MAYFHTRRWPHSYHSEMRNGLEKASSSPQSSPLFSLATPQIGLAVVEICRNGIVQNVLFSVRLFSCSSCLRGSENSHSVVFRGVSTPQIDSCFVDTARVL